MIYGHATDIPGGLQIASVGRLESSSGTCGNGVYHVGAPANLTELQAIEHLWEETHTKGANGGALVVSTMEGVLVVATGKTSHKERVIAVVLQRILNISLRCTFAPCFQFISCLFPRCAFAPCFLNCSLKATSEHLHIRSLVFQFSDCS